TFFGRNSNFATTRESRPPRDFWSCINKIVTVPEVVWISQPIKAVEDSMPEVHSSWNKLEDQTVFHPKISESPDDLIKEDIVTYLSLDVHGAKRIMTIPEKE
ncbi:hypothetical protein E4U35_000324, partial [Claviceps purpurea]